ncbi:hypothetical protein D3C79_1101260 [compost metagenome]
MWLACEPLRTADQHVRTVQLEQIRTFPHVARVLQAVYAMTRYFAAGLPAAQISRLVQQNLAALL